MGIFSSLTKGLGNILGIGESSTKYARKAGEADAARLQEGIDYTRGILDPRVERETQAADALLGFYSGDPVAQKSFIDTTRASPLYESLIDEGRQGVAAGLSATGNIRGGAGPTAFYQQEQKTLQDLVNQNLRGLQMFASPVDTSAIPSLYGALGDSEASKYQAIGQAKQDKYGNILGLGKTILGAI